MTTWQCPYCRQKAELTQSLDSQREQRLGKKLAAITRVSVCPNPECMSLTLTVFLKESEEVNAPGGGRTTREGKVVNIWHLVPESRARPWPEYVHPPVVQDYDEACAIETTSPKASAAVSRRCLQTLIRDFFGISKSRLVDEINALDDQVDS